MKKSLPFIGIFILYLLVFFSAVYARPSDHRPSDIAINNAIAWAQSLVWQPAFPVTGTSGGSSWSTYKCTDFVANAYGFPAVPYTAGLFWAVAVDQHPGDWNAPRGSLVFFSPNTLNSGKGHVAISTGNENLIEAGNELILQSTISNENHAAVYLGWAWPPSTWPGRTDVFRATALTWALQAGKALILTIASWAIFLIIQSVIARRKQAHAGGGTMEKTTGA